MAGRRMPSNNDSSRDMVPAATTKPADLVEFADTANCPIGWGFCGNQIKPKLVVSGQNGRFRLSSGSILSIWRGRQACTAGRPVADIGPLGRPLVAADSYPSTCCRSSVVEHSIGNGEVDSSILSGSTIYLIDRLRTSCNRSTYPVCVPQIVATKPRESWPEKCAT